MAMWSQIAVGSKPRSSRRSGQRTNALPSLPAGVDDALRHVEQLGVGVLRQLPKHAKRADVVDLEPLHDDALGLTDAIARGERRLQLLTLATGQDRRRCVRREDHADGLRLAVPELGLEPEQV